MPPTPLKHSATPAAAAAVWSRCCLPACAPLPPACSGMCLFVYIGTGAAVFFSNPKSTDYGESVAGGWLGHPHGVDGTAAQRCARKLPRLQVQLPCRLGRATADCRCSHPPGVAASMCLFRAAVDGKGIDNNTALAPIILEVYNNLTINSSFGIVTALAFGMGA